MADDAATGKGIEAGDLIGCCLLAINAGERDSRLLLWRVYEKRRETIRLSGDFIALCWYLGTSLVPLYTVGTFSEREGTL